MKKLITLILFSLALSAAATSPEIRHAQSELCLARVAGNLEAYDRFLSRFPEDPLTATASRERDTIKSGNPLSSFPECAGVSVACKGHGEKLTGYTKCCEGFAQQRPYGTCEFLDSSLRRCDQQNPACPVTTGCFKQRESDVFSDDEADDDPREAEDAGATGATTLVAENENHPFQAGASCAQNADCESYACEQNKCVEKYICRLADVGEAPGPDVNCESGLIIKDGKCAHDDSQTYPGMVDEMVEQENECKYSIKPEEKAKVDEAIASLRAMEYLFTSVGAKGEDCLLLTQYLFKQFKGGQGSSSSSAASQAYLDFHKRRKAIINNFNREFKIIEEDQHKLENANPESTTMLVIHQSPLTGEGESISEADLASRKTSGYDALKLMYRRNLLFQALESEMLKLVKDTSQKINALEKNMGGTGGDSSQTSTSSSESSGWKDKHKKWTIVDVQHKWKDYKCGSSGFLGLFPKKKIRQRWHHRVKVTGDTNEVFDGEVGLNLQKIGGSIPSGKFFLIDTLEANPGKRKQKKTAAQLKAKRDEFKAKVKAFYLGLREQGSPEDFLYEPELLDIKHRKCFLNPADPSCNQEGKKFDFLEKLSDRVFAHYIAFSAHKKGSYKGFFPNANTMRRKLFAKYVVDLQNLQEYYDLVIKKREEQNACLEKSLKYVVEEYIRDEGGVEEGSRVADNGSNSSGSSGGATSGGGSRGSITGLNAGPGAPRSSLLLTPASRRMFSPNLSLSPAASLQGTSSQIAGGGGSQNGSPTSGGAGLSADELSALAANKKFLKNANDAARKQGIDVDKKEKELSGLLAASGRSGSLGAVNSGNSAGSLRGFQVGELSVSQTPEAKSGQNIIEVAGEKGLIIEQSKGAGDSSGGAGTQGISEAALTGGNGEYSIAASAASAADPTGMSDEEKDVMMANYERTRGQYNPDEGDGLFDKVSKAYVRNLNRILQRKRLD